MFGKILATIVKVLLYSSIFPHLMSFGYLVWSGQGETVLKLLQLGNFFTKLERFSSFRHKCVSQVKKSKRFKGKRRCLQELSNSV
jgi:hypothetical protein